METGTRLDQEISALKGMARDPTLESCCRRDLEEQIRHISLKSVLDASDRSQERKRLIDNVLKCNSSHSRSPVDRQEDQQDEHLKNWRAGRLRELQRCAEQKAKMLAEGYGTMSTVDEEDLQKIIKRPHHRTVCHVAAGYANADLIDEVLDGLAQLYLGCLFLRCVPHQRNSWLQRLGIMPKGGLVCLEQGAVVGRYLADERGELDLEESISAWLHDSGCRKEWQLCEEAEYNEDNVYNELSTGKLGGRDGESGSGCEVCGRDYPHEHVRALRPDGFI